MTIPFDFFVLAAVAAELRAALVGGRVQKVQQPSANEVILSTFSKAAGGRRLLLSVDPHAARVHFTQVKRDNPTQPPGFCQIARKYLEGAWIEAVELPFPDRVLHLVCRSVEGERVTLICELMGRNSNLVLVSGANTVRGVLRHGGEREMHHGAVYKSPPGISTDAPFLSKFAETEAALRPEGELLQRVALGEFAPHSIQGDDGHTLGIWAFETKSVIGFPRESISVALDTFWATKLTERAEDSAEAAAERARLQALARVEKQLAELEKTFAEAALADQHEEAGNLLLAHLAQIPRGAESTTVEDFYNDSAPRTITLDPKKSPHENAQGWFDRARKARDAAEYATRRKAELEAEQAALQSGPLAPTSGGNSRNTPQSSPMHGGQGAKKFDGHKIRTLTLDGEWTLYIGENATSNDYLLTKVAGPKDLWFHIRGVAGAHGVLRTNGHPERVPDPILRRAAGLVAARSGEKHAGLVPVDYTERRYVRKPRGAKPGQAVYTVAKTMDVEPATP
ncbi:Rqc2 family fibronectin-binding protein [Armatimonas rosea]|uniref:Putative ribosome quality control (RQC) complex YloA/Tae2 family protein n=1 Tax=Armatimonas rosea TaxID=685828 RepID=A0A7W9SVS1_ARMRO|nr:NFACT RNA binding domain-containing protein [Armatimonas rosea]MBB6052829.1 putative ribosome quality control (RQC) complex YloA/Tae2 family protein [Armatimonas rosea]